MNDGEKMKFRDELQILVFDKDGNIKNEHHDYDLITESGLAEIAKLISGGSTNSFGYIAIGTGTTGADPSDTALENEISRLVATVEYTTTTDPNDTVQLTATFSQANDTSLTGTSAVTESGVFNTSSGGVMLCRQVFSPINVNWDSGDSIQLVWKIVVS